MSYREKAPEVRSIANFNVPEIAFQKSAKGTLYFHEESPGIGAASVFWLIPVSKQSQSKAFQALASVEMLLSGGDGKSEKEILQHIEHLGASVGNDSEQLYARIHFRCAKQVVEDVFAWVLHHVERAEYPQDEIERYGIIKRASIERRMQTPGYWSDRKAKEILYKDLPWVGTFGSLEDFSALQREDLMNFHQKHIKNSPGVLFFSGDIDSRQKENLLKIWESYERASFVWSLMDENVNNGTSFIDPITHSMPNSSQVSMRWMKHISHLEESLTHQYSLLNMVLGGYFGSRLMQELREKQGLTYGISSYFKPLWKGRSWNISGEMNSENTEKALISMGNIIEELQQHPIPADELDRAKRYYAGMFRSGFDGPFAQATKALQTLVRSNSSDYYSQTLDYIWNVDSSMLLQLAQNELDTKTFVKVVAGEV
jgi:predicted Zn-dependent peptidase